MQKILVPNDFSDNAMKAALYAAEIAKKNGATVFLLHAIEPVADSIRQPFPLHEKYLEEIANRRMKELDATRTAVANTYPELKIEAELAKGTVTTSILDFAESNQIDLIVMGTKGATDLKEIFMGSVAAGTIGRTIVHVLAIPNEYAMEEPDAILFATNHFEENKYLLNKIVDVAKLFSTTIHVAVFVDTDNAEASEYIHNTRQLNHYMAFLMKTFPDLSNDKNEVDIIAMITYPKSFWERLMKKSVTKKMAFHSKIPVLAIPAK